MRVCQYSFSKAFGLLFQLFGGNQMGARTQRKNEFGAIHHVRTPMTQVETICSEEMGDFFLLR